MAVVNKATAIKMNPKTPQMNEGFQKIMFLLLMYII